MKHAAAWLARASRIASIGISLLIWLETACAGTFIWLMPGVLSGKAFAQQPPDGLAVIIDRRILSDVPASNARLLPDMPGHTIIVCVWQSGNCRRLTSPVRDKDELSVWAQNELANEAAGSDETPPNLRDLPDIVKGVYNRAILGFHEYPATADAMGSAETRLRVWVIAHPDVRLNGAEKLSLTQVVPGPGCLSSAAPGGDTMATYTPPTDITSIEIVISLEGMEGWQRPTELTIARLFGYPDPRVHYLGQLGFGCKPGPVVDLGKPPFAHQCAREQIRVQAKPASACVDQTVPPPPRPVARNLTLSADWNPPIGIDIDVPGDTRAAGATIRISRQPAAGKTRLSGQSRIRYDGTASKFVAQDQFAYQLVDARGQASDEATVTILFTTPKPHTTDLGARDTSITVPYGGSEQRDLVQAGSVAAALHPTLVITANPDGAVSAGPGTEVRITPPHGRLGPSSFRYALEAGGIRGTEGTVTILVKEPDILLPNQPEIHMRAGDVKDVRVLENARIPPELTPPSGLRLKVEPVKSGEVSSKVAPGGSGIVLSAAPTVTSGRTSITFSLYSDELNRAVATSSIPVELEAAPPPAVAPAPDCASTNVPGGMFLVASGPHLVPEDARDFFMRFGVTSVNVDKPFCIARRVLTADDLREFARNDPTGWKQTDQEPGAVASHMTIEFAERYAASMSAKEAGGVLALPTRQQWLAAFLVALEESGPKSDPAPLDSFRSGMREWSRDGCEPAYSGPPKHLVLGQTKNQYFNDDPVICWPGIFDRGDTGFRVVKEYKGAGP